MRVAIIAAVLVIIAACTSTLTEPIQISQSQQTDISDILEVTYENVYPYPISPSDSFTLQVNIKNIHSSVVARDVKCYVSDSGVFHASNPDGEKTDLYPGDTQVYEFDFVAPSRKILANAITSDIEYICRHSGKAESTLQYPVFDPETLRDMQIAGQSIPAVVSSSESAGPLKIILEPGSDYFMAGKDGKIRVKLSNLGSYGIVGGTRRNVIDPGWMKVYIESEQMNGCNIRYAGPGSFSCSYDEIDGKGYCKCVNTAGIKIIEGESPEMSFRFRIRDDAAPNGRKTYLAKAEARYNYYIRRSVSIDVQES